METFICFFYDQRTNENRLLICILEISYARTCFLHHNNQRKFSSWLQFQEKILKRVGWAVVHPLPPSPALFPPSHLPCPPLSPSCRKLGSPVHFQICIMQWQKSSIIATSNDFYGELEPLKNRTMELHLWKTCWKQVLYCKLRIHICTGFSKPRFYFTKPRSFRPNPGLRLWLLSGIHHALKLTHCILYTADDKSYWW